MFHKSKLHDFDHQFPHDRDGHIPVGGDHWRDMQFEHEGMDPHEAGISEEEKVRRTKYLNATWWPEVLQKVEDERERLASEHGESFIDHWSQIVHDAPDVQHGFGVG